MIEIKIRKKINCDCFYDLRINGHSGFAKKGNDIVCAGVSTLVQTFHTLISTYFADKVEINDDGKCFKITIEDIGIENENVVHYCDFLLTGLFLIEKHYPSFVKIIILED